jgi:LuxR family maltose regulon positive regulatory protein
MTMPILTTKLYIPPSRRQSVKRERLLSRLNAGFDRKLVLVAAPAGFGKTTLVSEWIDQLDCPVAWLSLDENDSDQTRFLAYMIATLQTIESGIGVSLSEALQSNQLPPLEQLLTTLLNDIAIRTDDFVLVLDDYHVIENPAIDQAMTFLLDYLPPHMHLVILTREDPPLPLSRLRARGQLTEVRASDLRFSIDEARDFFGQTMGLQLLEQDIKTLEDRTEGWIAGLQLAALSLQASTNNHDFIESFGGTHHFVLDYLVEEVLHHQPEHIQTFLLHTSILKRLSGSLCDALMIDGDVSGQDVLEVIHQANLFLVPLDKQRQWYRYHHLFGDLLRQRLHQQLDEDHIRQLHFRASEWYEQHGLRDDAIYHALIAEQFEWAADLIELAWSETHSSTFHSPAQRTWMEALPHEMLLKRPVLSAGYAWTLLDFGDLDKVDVYLSAAEQYFHPTEANDRLASEMIVKDKAEFQKLPATVAAARAYLSMAMGNIPHTIQHAQHVLDLTSVDEHHQRGMAASLMGLAYWSTGNLGAAYQSMYDGMTSMFKMGNINFALSNTFGLADIQMAQGQLRDALYTYEQSLQVAKAQTYTVQGIADFYMGLGDLYREKNELESAQTYLQQSENLGEQTGLPDWRYRFCRIQSRMKRTQGDFDTALDLLDEAEGIYYATPVPNVRPTAAYKAGIWIEQGHIDKALAWAREKNLSLDTDVTFLNEFQLITLTRIYIAQASRKGDNIPINEVDDLLARLADAAEFGARFGSMIEILILQARLQQIKNDMSSALKFLQHAISLAEPQGYIRIFVDEGKPMQQLLTEAQSRQIMPGYVKTLLSAFDSNQQSIMANASQALIEPLSERELEVLQLIAEGLSNRQISERLFLALSTIKGHNRNIFDKLGVKRRTEAVARASELDLL